MSVSVTKDCIPQIAQTLRSGYRELDAVDFTLEDGVAPRVRLFVGVSPDTPAKLYVRIAEGIDQLRCDLVIDISNAVQSEVEVLPTDWSTAGVPNDLEPEINKRKKEVERDCTRLSRINPALREMPLIVFNRETQDYTTVSHAGTCRSFANSLAIAFSLREKKRQTTLVVVGRHLLMAKKHTDQR